MSRDGFLDLEEVQQLSFPSVNSEDIERWAAMLGGEDGWPSSGHYSMSMEED